MKKTLSLWEAADMLRSDENAYWSYTGALALIEYLQDLEDDLGEEMEMDVIALRSEFSEYESLIECAEDCLPDWKEDLNITEEDTEEDIEQTIREYLHDHTLLLEFDGGIIVSYF